MTKKNDIDNKGYDQFNVEKSYHLDKLDFINWFRFYYLIKDLLRLSCNEILEIGSGSGLVKNCIFPFVKSYKVVDINPNLKPDYVADLREYNPELGDSFDCIIAADVLEHIPFSDLGASLSNFFKYLQKDGYLLITIPHRRSNFLLMTPTYVPHVFTVPTGFLSLGSFYRRFIKRKIWIDPDHCWEIGDGNVKRKDVEYKISQSGFNIEKFEKLLYVDYWVLTKS